MPGQPFVAFFIATARSGTQWTADRISTNPDLLHVEHEPLRYAYDSRHCLRNPDMLKQVVARQEVVSHFDRIDEINERGVSYVEVGFPPYAMAPALRERFGERLRLVHLLRDPVRVAASLVTHRWYVEEGRAHLMERMGLTPFDIGATFTRYTDKWDEMSAYEKGLFLWAEVHSFGLEQERVSAEGSFRRFRFEELVSSPALFQQLQAFLGLPSLEPIDTDSARRVTDRYRLKTSLDIPWESINDYPEIVDLALEFGYDTYGLDIGSLEARYKLTPVERAQRLAQRCIAALQEETTRAATAWRRSLEPRMWL